MPPPQIAAGETAPWRATPGTLPDRSTGVPAEARPHPHPRRRTPAGSGRGKRRLRRRPPRPQVAGGERGAALGKSGAPAEARPPSSSPAPPPQDSGGGNGASRKRAARGSPPARPPYAALGNGGMTGGRPPARNSGQGRRVPRLTAPPHARDSGRGEGGGCAPRAAAGAPPVGATPRQAQAARPSLRLGGTIPPNPPIRSGSGLRRRRHAFAARPRPQIAGGEGAGGSLGETCRRLTRPPPSLSRPQREIRGTLGAFSGASRRLVSSAALALRGDLCFIRSPPTAVAPALSPFACRFSLIAQSFPWCRRRPLTRAPGGLPPTRTCRKPACAYGSARHAQSACLATQWQGKCPLTPLARASRHVARHLANSPRRPPPGSPPLRTPLIIAGIHAGGGLGRRLSGRNTGWRLLWGEFGLP